MVSGWKYRIILVLLILGRIIYNGNAAMQAQNIDSLMTELSRSSADSNRVLILYELGWQLKTSQPTMSENYAKQALDLSEKLEFLHGIALSTSLLGFHFRTRSDFKAAESYYTKSLEAREKLGSRLDIARTYYNLGKLYFDQQGYQRSIDSYEHALSLLYGSSEMVDLARIVNSLGAAYRHLGYYEKAVKALEFGSQMRLALMEKSKSERDSMEFAKSQLNLGSLFFDQGDFNHAEVLFLSALTIFNTSGSSTDQADVTNNLGLVYVSRSKLDSAQILFHEAMYKYEKDHDSLGIAQCLINIGKVELLLSDDQKAIVSISKANDIYGKLGADEGRAKAEFQLGSIWKVRQNFPLALEHYLQSLQYARLSGAVLTALELEEELSEVYSTLGRPIEAYAYAQAAIALKDSLNNVLLSSIFVEAELTRLQAEKRLLQSQSETNLQGKLYAEQRSFSYIIGLVLLAFIVLALAYFLRNRIKFIRSEKERMILRENAHRNAEAIRQMLANQEQRLMVAIASGQETERSRISQELHDSLGGLLSVIKLHFQSLEQKVTSTEVETQRRIGDLKGMIDNAVQEVRRISKNLTSGLLANFGIEAALNDLRDVIESADKLSVRLVVYGFEGEVRLTYSLELALFQMTSELVSNVLKHSEASAIDIELVRHQDRVSLMISDNGKGFERTLIKNIGQGLISIERRVQTLNGEFSIDSGKGNGTTITIELPYNASVL